MKVINKSNKIINIGQSTLLPDKTMDIPKEFATPVISRLIEMGILEEVKAQKAKAEDPKAPAKAAKE